MSTPFPKRMGGDVPDLVTTDEYPTYQTAIPDAYGETVVPERGGKPGRPQKPYKTPPG